jgi:phosphoribosylformylglycinamidine synthase PurS subunit
MRIKILIRLKNQILEPQGKVIEQSLKSLGFEDFSNIRQGKLIEIDLPDSLNEEEGPANSVPAAAVIRKVLALFGITGRKAHVGGTKS